MRILYVCQRVPYPPNRGDKIASYNAIRFLSERHEVIVACLANSPEELEHAEELRRQGFMVDVGQISPMRQKWNAMKALVTGVSLSVAFFRCEGLVRKLQDRIAKKKVDVVITFSSSMGQYARFVKDVPLIADFVDLDSRKWGMYCRFHHWPRSFVYRLEERRLLAHEKMLARRACCTLLRTEGEKSDCLELIPDVRVEVLSNGVDLDFFRSEEAELTSKSGKDIVFTGVMNYFPNVQGAAFFAREVFPLIRERHPDATFTIVGASPTKAVLRLGVLDGVEVTGSQKDIRPFLARARVSVAPLLLARGIQNKVLEAMSMSLPVVVTPAAFRGVDVDEGDGVFVAEAANDFARKVSDLLDDPDRAAALGRVGRIRVEERYVWSEQLGSLERLAHEVVGESLPDDQRLVDSGKS